MYDPSTRRELGAALAAAFLAGAWTERALLRRGSQAFDGRPPWLLPVVREVLAAYHRPPADRPRELAAYVALVLSERRTALPAPRVRKAFGFEPAMGRMPWPVPEVASPGALAERLGLEIGQLLWLADARGLDRGAQAPPEGDPALDPARDPRPHPGPRRGPRLRARALGPHACRAARRPGDRRPARPRG